MEHEIVPSSSRRAEAFPGPNDRGAPGDRRAADRDVRRRGGDRRFGAAAPSEEELVEEEITEPRLAPVDPLAGLDETRAEVEAAETEDERTTSSGRAAPLRRARPGARGAGRGRASRGGTRRTESVEFEESEDEEAETSTSSPARTTPDDDEDVLEDTPDFLEDAPEDDQLWFEQKPPKDFDFDD